MQVRIEVKYLREVVVPERDVEAGYLQKREETDVKSR